MHGHGCGITSAWVGHVCAAEVGGAVRARYGQQWHPPKPFIVDRLLSPRVVLSWCHSILLSLSFFGVTHGHA
jgi:hypothetical protein